MFKLTVFSVVLALSGCTKLVDTLGVVQETVAQTRSSMQMIIDPVCREYAIACKNEKQVMLQLEQAGACDMFEACDAYRSHMIATFEHINMLIADANLSMAIGDTDSADEVYGKVLELLNKLREQMRALGYLK